MKSVFFYFDIRYFIKKIRLKFSDGDCYNGDIRAVNTLYFCRSLMRMSKNMLVRESLRFYLTNFLLQEVVFTRFSTSILLFEIGTGALYGHH